MKFATIVLALFVAGSSAYCRAADESMLDLIYSPGPQAEKSPSPGEPASRQRPPGTGTCAVVINTPNDVRRNKDTLGTTFRDNPIISGQNPTIWLGAALLDLSKLGFSTVSANMAGNPSAKRIATLTTDLDKLYIWNHSLNLHATLVVRATILGGGGETLTKSYRVNSTKLNWWNSDAEFVDTLNLAAGRLLEQIAADIEGVCSSGRGT